MGRTPRNALGRCGPALAATSPLPVALANCCRRVCRVRRRSSSPARAAVPSVPPFSSSPSCSPPGTWIILTSSLEERKRPGLLHLLSRGKGGGEARGTLLLRLIPHRCRRSPVPLVPHPPFSPAPPATHTHPLRPDVCIVASPDRLIVVFSGESGPRGRGEQSPAPEDTPSGARTHRKHARPSSRAPSCASTPPVTSGRETHGAEQTRSSRRQERVGARRCAVRSAAAAAPLGAGGARAALDRPPPRRQERGERRCDFPVAAAPPGGPVKR